MGGSVGETNRVAPRPVLNCRLIVLFLILNNETLIMDTTDDQNTPDQNENSGSALNEATTQPSSKSPFIVTLDSWQYFRYQTHHIEIHGPDGRPLEIIGKAIKSEETENNLFRLHEQVALVSCLLGSVTDEVNLSMPAVLALADLFCRVQEVCKGRFK